MRKFSNSRSKAVSTGLTHWCFIPQSALELSTNWSAKLKTLFVIALRLVTRVLSAQSSSSNPSRCLTGITVTDRSGSVGSSRALLHSISTTRSNSTNKRGLIFLFIERRRQILGLIRLRPQVCTLRVKQKFLTKMRIGITRCRGSIGPHRVHVHLRRVMR